MGAALRVGYARRRGGYRVPCPQRYISRFGDCRPALAPLTALLGTGTYILADFELYPVHPDGRHALDKALRSGEKLELCHTRWDYERNHQPLRRAAGTVQQRPASSESCPLP